MIKYFAAFDPSSKVVYGIGHSVEDAIADAGDYMDEGENAEDLSVRECTKRFYDDIETHGGDITAWHVGADGICDLDD